MKKILMALFVTLLCVGAVASTFFLIDNSKPNINVKGTPTLGCSVSFDDLMNYASAEDDKGIKSFFIEEKSLSDIADYNYLTYVAIDEANNVRKQRVSVNVDSDVKTYHIEVLKPLQAQLRESLRASEYLALRNECGWDIDDSFVVEGVDYSTAETYDARISVKKHGDVEAIFTTVEVDDFNAPRIILSEETYRDWANTIYTDKYFLDFIDHIEDDNDDPDALYEKVVINWREVMMPFSSGLMTRGGTFTITYRVTDSDGNTGKATLKLLIEVPVYSSSAGEGE
ncbi:MAG: hypothetical protein IJI66_04260 [Erysipelotrichaceae bacterium]|nr:hypothetical protein [Erysipelotrichaceae bacterium]